MNQKIKIESVIGEAFTLWKKAMKYNLLFSILYFGLLIFFSSAIIIQTGMLEKFERLYFLFAENPNALKQEIEQLLQAPEFLNYTLLLTICSGIVYPLHIGLINIYQKIEKKEEIIFNDLLVGYNGINFFKYASYYICWLMIFNFLIGSIFPLGILWVTLTLLITPIMFFRNEPMGTAFISSFNAVKNNFLLIFLSVLFTALFGHLGIFAFFIGRIFTFPFWCAMVYVLYQHIFEEIKTEN